LRQRSCRGPSGASCAIAHVVGEGYAAAPTKSARITLNPPPPCGEVGASHRAFSAMARRVGGRPLTYRRPQQPRAAERRGAFETLRTRSRAKRVMVCLPWPPCSWSCRAALANRCSLRSGQSARWPAPEQSGQARRNTSQARRCPVPSHCQQSSRRRNVLHTEQMPDVLILVTPFRRRRSQFRSAPTPQR
jgi:hypothetical protein